MKIVYPFSREYRITQTYAQHVERAKQNGWCYMPGHCPSGIYYYGGIDYGCPVGTEIYGTEGTVEQVYQQTGGYGLHIRIRHPDRTLTIYAHLHRVFVAQGQSVTNGQLIALSGNTGNSTGPHLHLEHRDAKGIPVDPAEHLLPVSQTLSLINKPVVQFAVGDKVRLKSGCVYVNVRRAPSTSAQIVTTLHPEDTVDVKEVAEGWLCIFSIKNYQLWVHSSYMEKCA